MSANQRSVLYVRACGRAGFVLIAGPLGQVQESGNTFTQHGACYYCRLFLNGTLPKIAIFWKNRHSQRYSEL